MAAKKYTDCVQPGNYVDFGFNPVGIGNTILLLLTTGFIAFAVIAVAGGPAAIIYAIALVTSVIIYLNWWLFGRLICLGPDDRNCAIIGMVESHGPADPLAQAGDNDYSMNILLAPGPLDLNGSKESYWDAPQGHLVARNQKILDISRGYVSDGDSDVQYQKKLHCEFEGDGIRSLLDASYVVLAFLIAAIWFPVAWLGALFFALVALLSKIFLPDPGDFGAGDPRDVDPYLYLHTRDIVVLKGDWVYDSLHSGWNEIHPVMECQVVGRLADDQGWADFKYVDYNTQAEFSLATIADVERFRAFWCGALNDAKSADDGGSRKDPANDWDWHPSIDGCRPPPVVL